MSTAVADPFTQPTGGGAYPKIHELEGRLVLVTPSQVETVPGYQGQGTQQRWTTDIVVLDGPNAPDAYDGMWLSSAGMNNALKSAKSNGRMVLGRIEKAPSKASKEAGIHTVEALEAATAKWLAAGAKGERPGYTWIFAQHTEADAQTARNYLATRDPFA